MHDLYVPTAAVREVLEAVGVPADAPLTAAQCVEAVNAYVKARGLGAPAASAPNRALLDAALCDALFKGALRDGERYPTEVLRAELAPLFMARMARAHRVARGKRELLQRGAMPLVRITTEVRSGNKKAREWRPAPATPCRAAPEGWARARRRR